MGYFDFLIDENNQVPNPEKQYLYHDNVVWRQESLSTITVPIDKLFATNVRKCKNNSFRFNLQGMEGEFQTNYGWVFIEINEENLK